MGTRPHPQIVAVCEVHGVAVPQPTWSQFIRWDNLPHGSFQFWEPHAHSWEVIPYCANRWLA